MPNKALYGTRGFTRPDSLKPEKLVVEGNIVKRLLALFTIWAGLMILLEHWF